MAVQSQAKDSNAVKELLALLPERKIYNQNDPIGGRNTQHARFFSRTSIGRPIKRLWSIRT